MPPIDELLAGRVRAMMRRKRGCVEKQMFGGLAFMINGNLCVGVWRESLIARVGPEDYETALAEPFAQEFDITGRPMRGWVMIEPGGLSDDVRLAAWIERCHKFVRSLPAK